jgi:DNA-binding NarL/FixJ family response regulator
MIKVLLADDHQLIRSGLKRIIEEASDIKVIDEASNGKLAIKKFKEINPDVLILDISMPVMDGLDACKQLKELHPDAKILILTMYPGEQFALRLLKAGALGYITKGSSAKELHKAIRMVAIGETFLPEKSKDTVIMQLLATEKHSRLLEALSDREIQVLCLIAQGKKMKEIAVILDLSVKTIETYRSRILIKLQLKNNTDITLFAYQNKLT